MDAAEIARLRALEADNARLRKTADFFGEEVAKLRQALAESYERSDELAANVSALFGEFVNISLMTRCGGEVDEYDDVTASVREIVDDLAIARTALEKIASMKPSHWRKSSFQIAKEALAELAQRSVKA